MKAVGAEIDCGNDFGHSLLLELVFYVIGGDVSRLNGRSRELLRHCRVFVRGIWPGGDVTPGYL
jgi:hypothetical protein